LSARTFDFYLRGACAAMVAFFGLWTLLANAVVLSDHSFAELSRLSLLVLLAAVGLLLFLHKKSEFAIAPEVGGEQQAQTVDEQRPERGRATALQLLFALGLAALYAYGRQYLLFWALSVIYIGIMYWRTESPEARWRAVLRPMELLRLHPGRVACRGRDGGGQSSEPGSVALSQHVRFGDGRSERADAGN
jgi:hypothetical protein